MDADVVIFEAAKSDLSILEGLHSSVFKMKPGLMSFPMAPGKKCWIIKNDLNTSNNSSRSLIDKKIKGFGHSCRFSRPSIIMVPKTGIETVRLIVNFTVNRIIFKHLR